MTTLLSTRIKRGAKWLDENHPGWAQKINLNTLDMREGDYCVIGQSVGNFYKVIAACSYPFKWSIDHGFDIQFVKNEDDKYYETLRTLWIEQIERRLL